MISAGESATVGGDYRFTYGQTNTHSLAGIRDLGRGMGDAVKEVVQHVFRNAHTIIAYGKGYFGGMILYDKVNWLRAGRMNNGIFQQIDGDLFYKYGIHRQ